MLTQICRRGRLNGLIHDTVLSGNLLSTPFGNLMPTVAASSGQRTAVHLSKEVSRGKSIPSTLYNLILKYMNTIHPMEPFRHFKKIPHPINACVLPPFAIPVNHIKHNERNFSIHALHAGNSSIAYHGMDGYLGLGFIQSMWEFCIDRVKRTLIVVLPHKHLSSHDQLRNPYLSYPGLQCTLVYSRTESLPDVQCVIEPEKIISHVAYYKRPPGTFGINDATMVLTESLNRNSDL